MIDKIALSYIGGIEVYNTKSLPPLVIELLFLYAGGPLDVYNDQHLCLHFGIYIDEDKDHCMNSDGFARFLGLLESIPFHNPGQREHVTSDTR